MINAIIQILVAIFIGIVDIWLALVIFTTVYDAIMEASGK